MFTLIERLVSFIILKPIYGDQYVVAQAFREPGADPVLADMALRSMGPDNLWLGTGACVGWKFEDDRLVMSDENDNLVAP